MKLLSVIAASAALTAAASASEEIAFPAWRDKERAEFEAAGWLAGATLLTDESAPELLQAEPPKPEEIAGDLTPVIEIPEKFLPAYFAERPKTFLVDPQSLLSPADSRDRLNFLNYHASDSSIDLYVYLIGGDQEIPGEVRDEETIERFYATGRPAALVFYHLGAPQRAVLHLSPSLTDTISSAEQNRALESSVMQALESTKPAEQLEKFLNQMSIRIYWMERLLTADTASKTAALSAPAAAAPKTSAAKSARMIWLLELAGKATIPATVLLGSLVAILALSHWLRRSARYRFPEFDIEPRLGGTHAAGIGAVISFASATLPPASQRDQVPDYLRRA